jgi:hypothetical protein
LTGKEIPRLELPGVDPATPSEPVAPRRAAVRNGARARQETVELPPAAPKPAERRPSAPKPSRAPAERRHAPSGPGRAAGPVVGMGDHVPLFMRRPVPNAELLPKLNDD